MSDQQPSTQSPLKSDIPTPDEIINLDPIQLNPEHPETDEIQIPHENCGHTSLHVGTIPKTECKETDKVKEKENWIAVPVPVPATDKQSEPQQTTSTATSSDEEKPCCSHHCDQSTKAIVPLSSSLPSKLLRLHAKRSAQALLHQVQLQSLALGSQHDEELCVNECADIFDFPVPKEPTAMSPPPPSSTPVENCDERLVDVGMGSSIGDSEESEEDDELKPLAVDNHVLHDVDLSSPPESVAGAATPVLSEANLEKFRKHHPGPQYHYMDNIYLHPNFRHEHENESRDVDDSGSPPPAVAPANSPIDTKRVHRSFLTMKKPVAVEAVVEKASSVLSHATTASTAEATTDQPIVNEIDNLDPALIPHDDLSVEIVEAVEYYFSNENILKDAFLLKHVRRNKEGFVSLKLVSSFKRVRQLTKDWRVVGYAVRRKSRKIELNDVGTKVRRLEPLPNFDETMPSRTIVACDLPLEKLTIEKVSDIFSKCGEIALIRILKPGMAIPVDVRQFMNKYPEMQQKECALVEYLESSSAREARNLQGSFQVYEMVPPKKKTGKKAVIQVAAPVARMVENYRYFNEANYERTRGGSFSGAVAHDVDLRFKLKRNNSDFYPRNFADAHPQGGPHYNHHHQYYNPTHRGSFGADHHPALPHHFQHHQPRGSIAYDSSPQTPSSPGNNPNFFAYSPRRYSNTSTIPANPAALGSGVCGGSGGGGELISSSTILSSANINNNNNNNNNPNNSANNSNVTAGANLARRLSNCSDSYSDVSRRPSNCSENVGQRRDSNCSENCPCSRRVSDYNQTEAYRKTSQGSVGNEERRFSNGSMHFERTFSTGSDMGGGGVGVGVGVGGGNGSGVGVGGGGGGGNCGSATFYRRMSNDFHTDRRQSVDTQTQTSSPYEHDGNFGGGGGGGGYNMYPRRYSNSFNPSSKLAAYDNAQYINGRRISSDSGYDRRYSFGSEYEGSPRSRTGSFLNNYKFGGDYDGQPRSRTNSFLDGSPRSRSGSFAQRAFENLVRTPIGPDGSKGFTSRTRKFGQTVSPV